MTEQVEKKKCLRPLAGIPHAAESEHQAVWTAYSTMVQSIKIGLLFSLALFPHRLAFRDCPARSPLALVPTHPLFFQ
jgi:hypothetical protein